MDRIEDEKRLAAEASAHLAEDGMTLGLGTGSTVAYLLPALADRRLGLRCVATSPATEARARELGLRVMPFSGFDRIDLAIDGADQIALDGWLIKGGGAAHTREKIVAAAASRFVVIASSEKVVERLIAPVPFEALEYGIEATLRAIGPAELRDTPRSPDGGLIGDYLGDPFEPSDLACKLANNPGVISHGLFAPELVAEIIVGRDDRVVRWDRANHRGSL